MSNLKFAAVEVELKLLLAPKDVAALRRLELLQRYSVGKPRARRLASTYFDTPAQAPR